jgi:NarL family two-component system response regulator LiaR
MQARIARKAAVGEGPESSEQATRSEQPLRAIIADDDPFARKMIKDALQRAGVIVIAEAHNGRQAVDLTRHYRPDVVLMDVVMPELDGIAATRRIVKQDPQQIVVILTTADDDEIGMLGLRAGASGFLAKDVDVDALPQTLLGVFNGEAAISRRLSMRLVEHLRRAPDGPGGLRPVKSPLTPREWEVVDLLAQSKTTDQIAELLVLSSETVRSHVKNILRKLNARAARLSRGSGRQREEEAVAGARRRRHADLAAVTLHHAPDDGEAETDPPRPALAAPALPRLEDALALPFGDHGALAVDGEGPAGLRAHDRDVDLAALARSVLQRVRKEVPEDAAEQCRVAGHDRHRVDVQVDVALADLGPEHVDAVVEHRAEVDRLALQRLAGLARVDQQRLDEQPHPRRDPHQGVDVAPRLEVEAVAGPLLEHRGDGLGHHERLQDLVRGERGEVGELCVLVGRFGALPLELLDASREPVDVTLERSARTHLLQLQASSAWDPV